MNTSFGILANETTAGQTPPADNDKILIEAELETELDQKLFDDNQTEIASERMKYNSGKIALQSVEAINKLEMNDAVVIGLEHNLGILGLAAESVKTDKDSIDGYIAVTTEGLGDILNNIGALIAKGFDKLLSLLGSTNAEVRLIIRENKDLVKNANKVNKEQLVEIETGKWKKDGENEVLAGITTPMVNVIAPADAIKNGVVKIEDLDLSKAPKIFTYVEKDFPDISKRVTELNMEMYKEYKFITDSANGFDKTVLDAKTKNVKNLLAEAKAISKTLVKGRKNLEDGFNYSKADGTFHVKEVTSALVSNTITVSDTVDEIAKNYIDMNNRSIKVVKNLTNSLTSLSRDDYTVGTGELINVETFTIRDSEGEESYIVSEVEDLKEDTMKYAIMYNEVMTEISALIKAEAKFAEFLIAYFNITNRFAFENLRSIMSKRREIFTQIVAPKAEDL